MGVQIGGLSAGTYDIYITARNTSTGAHVQNLYLGKSATAANYDFSGYTTQTLTYASANAATSAWLAGSNYAVFSITISSGEFINLASIGTADRGFLNSVQIVAVPEPSTFALFGGLGALIFIAVRRKRS